MAENITMAQIIQSLSGHSANDLRELWIALLKKMNENEPNVSDSDHFEDLVPIDSPVETLFDDATGDLRFRYLMTSPLNQRRACWHKSRLTAGAQLDLILPLSAAVEMNRQAGRTRTKATPNQ